MITPSTAELGEDITEDIAGQQTDTVMCLEPGCDIPARPRSKTGPAPKYCAEHQPRTGSARTVKIQIGSDPKRGRKTDAAKIEETCQSWLRIAAAVVTLAASQEDAADITAHIPSISASVAHLAEHEPWLRRALTSTSDLSSGRAGAWLGVGIAITPLTISILARHDLIPPALRSTIAIVTAPPAPQAPQDPVAP